MKTSTKLFLLGSVLVFLSYIIGQNDTTLPLVPLFGILSLGAFMVGISLIMSDDD